MAILYKNGDLIINVKRINILTIHPINKNKVVIYVGTVKQVISCESEEEARQIHNNIYKLMLQEQ